MNDITFPLRWRIALIAPALAVFLAFWLLPMAALAQFSGDGHAFATYRAMLTNSRYLSSLGATVVLSAAVTAATLVLSVIAGLLLARREFAFKRTLLALLTFPLAFPGVVVGFMVIMLAGRQGLIGALSLKLTGDRWVFAYSMSGLFLGYLYFSIPRVIVTVMASATRLDASLEEAARSLGASPWRIMRRRRIARAVAGIGRGGRGVLRDLDGRVRHGVYARHRHRRAADDHLHRVHAEREHGDGRGAVDRARHRHVGGAGVRAQRERRGGGGERMSGMSSPARPNPKMKLR